MSQSVRRTDTPVEEFIAANDPDGSLATLDRVITAALPGATRVLWQGVFWGGTDQSIIGYGATVQRRRRGADVEWFLLGLARQDKYLSLYVNAAEGRTPLATLYGKRLGATKVGPASISFRSAHAVDLGALDEMVRHAGQVMEWS